MILLSDSPIFSGKILIEINQEWKPSTLFLIHSSYTKGLGPREIAFIFIFIFQKTNEWNSCPCHVYKH